MSLKTHLNLFHTFNHFTLLFFLFISNNYWLLLISFLVYTLILIVGVSAGLHRYFTHKSFKTSKFWENFILFVSIPATLGTPITWVAGHRLHHAYSDTKKDPHSPKSVGFLNSYIHNWQELTVSSSLVSDIAKNKTAKFIHNNYVKILLFYAIVLYAINPIVGIIVYSIPAVLCFHATALVDSVCHTFGYRNFNTDDNSKNNLFVNAFTMGEGLHNNHHINPKLSNFSTKKYEFDPTWYFIKLIRGNHVRS